MNKKDLAQRIATETGLKQAQVLEVLNKVVDIVEEELSEGREVRYSGLATFFTKVRASSKGRNPQTGEAIQLESRTVPRVKIAERLKTVVRK